VTIDDVRATVEWEPRANADLGVTDPPSDSELRMIREELDPDGTYTG
jgi:glutaconate CoA-transferase subunit B